MVVWTKIKAMELEQEYIQSLGDNDPGITMEIVFKIATIYFRNYNLHSIIMQHANSISISFIS